MGNIVVGIHQPNFMPWLGYFYKIKQSDIFIFLDNVQFPKTGGGGYPNRVAININKESKWVTAPIQRQSGTWDINQTNFQDNNWRKKIIATLQGNYAKASFFKENKDFIFSLIEFESNNLAEFNMNFILEVSNRLNFDTKFVKSSDFDISTTSTQRLIDLIQKVDGNIYLSGSGGDNYQDKEMYEKENIKLIYNKMPKITYKQLKTDKFIGGLSIVDTIFNLGFDNLKNRFSKNEI
jgi:hypothetical protein